jgi:hypothetical protein
MQVVGAVGEVAFLLRLRGSVEGGRARLGPPSSASEPPLSGVVNRKELLSGDWFGLWSMPNVQLSVSVLMRWGR